jgi:hypothetical protein
MVRPLMMQESAIYQQIGRFIVMFQRAEQKLTELLVLMAEADVEFIRILVNELEYSERVKAADVMFGRFFDLRNNPDQSVKAQFHALMVELLRLGERRNEIVHSKYTTFISVKGVAGLRRENSKLKPSKGLRAVEEEDLLPASFEEDFKSLSVAHQSLEVFRLKAIDWLWPEE